ncbi:MAG: T9SS type A sorting domain-containing protein [Melioribacteraceae bacterium]
MKRIYLLFFYISFIGYRLQAQELDPYQFFPVNIGDHWEYTQAGPDIIYTVLRDSIDQKDSSRFVFFYDPLPYYGANYRIDKNHNVFYLPQFDNWLLYKLDAKVGESWKVKNEDRAKVLNIFQAYVFGKLTTVKTIGFFRLTLGDTVITPNSIFMYWQKLAYGFGMISEENGAEQPTLLRGCRINKVVYGTVNVKENLNDLPLDFTLYQNYPNPFNPATTITFALRQSSHVVLKILDVLGKEIQVFADGVYEAGKFEVNFDASKLPSGVYFYNLTTGTNSITKKMLLMK